MIPEFVNDSAFSGLLAAFGLLAVMCIVAGIAYFALSYLIKISRRNSPDTHYTRILSASQGPAALFLAILGIFLAYLLVAHHADPAFDFANGHSRWTVRVWLITVIIQASYLGSRIVRTLLQWYLDNVAQRTESDLDNRLVPHLSRITPIILYGLAALMALDVIGLAITPLIAGLGIGGIAVALALQPTLSNLFSGMFMVSEGELNEGDFIELDGGPSGFVTDVSWRSTKIRDRFNNLIMIPNSKIMESIMTNYYSQSMAVTIIVPCGISYESDLEQVEKVALEIANGVRDDLEQAVDDFDPVVRFSAFGESNIDFNVIMQANDRIGSFLVKHELIKRLHSKFKQEGIEINYPVRKLVSAPEELNGLLRHDKTTSDMLDTGQPSQNSGE